MFVREHPLPERPRIGAGRLRLADVHAAPGHPLHTPGARTAQGLRGRKEQRTERMRPVSGQIAAPAHALDLRIPVLIVVIGAQQPALVGAQFQARHGVAVVGRAADAAQRIARIAAADVAADAGQPGVGDIEGAGLLAAAQQSGHLLIPRIEDLSVARPGILRPAQTDAGAEIAAPTQGREGELLIVAAPVQAQAKTLGSDTVKTHRTAHRA